MPVLPMGAKSVRTDVTAPEGDPGRAVTAGRGGAVGVAHSEDRPVLSLRSLPETVSRRGREPQAHACRVEEGGRVLVLAPVTWAPPPTLPSALLLELA